MKTKLSIVIAMLNEADTLDSLPSKVFAATDAIPEIETELILVDDGSTDSTWTIIRDWCRRDRRVRGLRLSRNFGNHAALLAGFRVASGDIGMNLAADLQTPLELIGRMFREFQAGAEIVLGARRQRADSAIDQFCARVFYRTLNLLAAQRMPAGGIDIFLANRTVMNELIQVHGRNTSILGLLMNLGFDQRVIEYDRPARLQGQSKWTFRKKVKLFADGIFAFSGLPLRLCLPLGAGLVALGLAGLAISLCRHGTAVSLCSLVSLAAILAGVQFAGIALLGEYLYRVFQEASQHPVFVVREDTGKPVAK